MGPFLCCDRAKFRAEFVEQTATVLAGLVMERQPCLSNEAEGRIIEAIFISALAQTISNSIWIPSSCCCNEVLVN